MGGLLGGGWQRVRWPPLQNYWGDLAPVPPPPPPPCSYAYASSTMTWFNFALMRFQASTYARCPEPHNLKGHWNGLECPPDINQTDRDRIRQTNREKIRQTDREIIRQRIRQTERIRQTDRKPDRQRKNQ